MESKATDPRDRENLSWNLTWAEDRRDDRRGMQVALCFAVLAHGVLLVLRLAESERVSLPQPDAVIFPTRNVAIKEPAEPPPPEAVVTPPEPAAVRVAVPAELVPPEPVLLPETRPVAMDLALLEAPVRMVPELSLPEAPPQEGPVRFTSEMNRPVRVGGSKPAYTEAARRTRTEGVVVLEAVIDRQGRVVDVAVLRALGFGLTEAAVQAVETWRFEPATLNGRAIAVRYSLTVRFSLR